MREALSRHARIEERMALDGNRNSKRMNMRNVTTKTKTQETDLME